MSRVIELFKQSALGQVVPAQEEVEGNPDFWESPHYGQVLWPAMVRGHRFRRIHDNSDSIFSDIKDYSANIGFFALESALDGGYATLGVVLGALAATATGIGAVGVIVGLLGLVAAKVSGNMAENAAINRIHGVKLSGRRNH